VRTRRNPEPPALTFRGLDLCDGCGTRLAPGDRLSGLCAACLDTIRAGPLKHRPTENAKRRAT